MSRVEENKELVELMTNLAKEKPLGTFEEMTCFHLGTIATMLADIAKSLAILADNLDQIEKKYAKPQESEVENGNDV